MVAARRYPAILSLLLGAAAACGFAPLDLWPLTLACLAAWAALVHAAPTARAALWRGYAFGLGHFTVNNNWFQHAFDFQDKMPPVLGYFAAVALAVYLAVFPAAAAGIAWRFRCNRPNAGPDAGFALALGAAWIATEWLRAVLFTGYAWDPLGVVWVPVLGVARAAALTGTYALSGLTVLLAALALPARRGRWRPFAVGAAAVALLALSEPWTRAPDADPAGPRVRTVQPNVGQLVRGPDDAELLLRPLLANSGAPGTAPRLVLWPEGVVRDLLEDGYPDWVYDGRWPERVRGRIAGVLGPRDRLMTGGTALVFDREARIAAAANAVFAIGPRGRVLGRYDKAHLVPYGEYLPLPWLLRPLGLARLVPGDLDFSPGPGPRGIDLPPFGRVGVQVCYEIIFSGRVAERGAGRPRMIFNPSNDAWFGTWGPPQHLGQARMRALEEGLPVVRATPTGISAVIAADGRLLAHVPPDRAGAAEVALPPALPPTPFARVGNWAALLTALILACGAVASRRRVR